MNRLILIGGGGHCKACIDVIEQEDQYEIFGILDEYAQKGADVLGYPVIGSDEEIDKYIAKDYFFLITVGQIRTSKPRERLFNLLIKKGAMLATVVSPRAYISKYANIGVGTIIMHDALVNPDSEIGRNCIINSKALIEHDVVIGDNCHVSTSSVINGGVVLGQGTFFGSNAVTKEYIKSTDYQFVKAGAVFVGDKDS